MFVRKLATFMHHQMYLMLVCMLLVICRVLNKSWQSVKFPGCIKLCYFPSFSYRLVWTKQHYSTHHNFHNLVHQRIIEKPGFTCFDSLMQWYLIGNPPVFCTIDNRNLSGINWYSNMNCYAKTCNNYPLTFSSVVPLAFPSFQKSSLFWAFPVAQDDLFQYWTLPLPEVRAQTFKVPLI